MNLKHFERGILLIVVAFLNIFIGRWIDAILIILGLVFLTFSFLEGRFSKPKEPTNEAQASN